MLILIFLSQKTIQLFDRMKEIEIEQDVGNVLLIKQNGKLSAISNKCSHYGAPLRNGVKTKYSRFLVLNNNFFSRFCVKEEFVVLGMVLVLI